MMFLFLNTYNPYIPWDTSLFEKAIGILRYHIGVAFNVGFWIFVILGSIFIIIRLVSFFGQ